MKILLFGGEGQLGQELRRRANDLNFDLLAPVYAEVDITDYGQVVRLAKESKPDFIVNAAAYTAVDRAESEPDKAFAVNRDGTLYLAQACKKVGARMIHISTDYVFDGRGNKPYSESDATNPLSIYGKSKLDGERAAINELSNQAAEDVAILRTAWLHGRYGMNFVARMIQLFEEKEVVNVVNDQFGTPTWAGWLAEVVLDMARGFKGGVYHAVMRGETSWFGFAQAIYQAVASELPNLKTKEILPQSTDASMRAAVRPAYSVLNTTKLERQLGRPLPTWQAGLYAHLRDLGYTVELDEVGI